MEKQTIHGVCPSKEQIIECYQRLNSVWKVGEELKIKGQTVHGILTKAGAIHKMNYFTEADKEVLKAKYVIYKNENRLVDLAKELKRTKPFLSRKAKELNLTDKTKRQWHSSKIEILKNSAVKRIVKNGHPKGMLGKKHSASFKREASERFIKMWADPKSKLNSDEHRQIKSDKMARWQRMREPSDNYTRTKFGWLEIDGKFLFMRSSWELNYAHYLNFLVRHNEIKKWEYEADTFWFEKIKRGVRSYKPDFKVYLLNGLIEYHEVKGWMDEKSITKLKRMRLYFPEIKIRVIGEKEYKAIKKQASIIPNWGTWITSKPAA